MVFHIAKEQGRSPNFKELEHAIKRNFGGLLEEDFYPVNIIKAHLGFPEEFLQVKLISVIGVLKIFLIKNNLTRIHSLNLSIISIFFLVGGGGGDGEECVVLSLF